MKLLWLEDWKTSCFKTAFSPQLGCALKMNIFHFAFISLRNLWPTITCAWAIWKCDFFLLLHRSLESVWHGAKCKRLRWSSSDFPTWTSARSPTCALDDAILLSFIYIYVRRQSASFICWCIQLQLNSIFIRAAQMGYISLQSRSLSRALFAFFFCGRGKIYGSENGRIRRSTENTPINLFAI